MSGRMRVLSVVAVLCGVIVVGGPADAQDPVGCSPPYAPVWGPAAGLPEIDADAVPVQAAGGRTVLNDAGTAEVVTQSPGPEVVVERESGVLRITASGQIRGWSAGDFDGDGDDEIWVSTFGVTPARSWVVPFSTPDGTVDVTSAGIEVADGVPYLTLPADVGENPVTTDFESSSAPFSGTTRVLDGAAILDVGAGGDATAVPPVVVFVDQSPFGVVEFGAGPQLVLQRLVISPAEQIEYTAVAADGDSVVFRTDGTLLNDGNRSALDPLLGALEGPAGRFLRITSYGFAPNEYEYLWSFDDPCSSLEVAAAPVTTAVPQVPPPAAPLSLTG